MNESERQMSQLSNRLKDLAERATVIWDTYQACGPGRVDCQLFDDVDAASKALDGLLQNDELIKAASQLTARDPQDWQEGLGKAIRQARDLAHRCACRPEGLCFVTGEAGLIPRRDQHAAFEDALEYIRGQCRDLARHE